jgi:hypothetical protein
VRFSTVSAALDLLRLDPAADCGGLPEAVAALVQAPPARVGFVPEVYNLAFYSWVCDVCFEDEADYWGFVDRVFIRFYAMPLYRVAFLMARPESVASATPRLWSWVRKGSRFEILEREEHRLVSRLSYPPRLFDRLHVDGLARGLRLAYERAEPSVRREVRMEVAEHGETETRFEVTWREGDQLEG